MGLADKWLHAWPELARRLRGDDASPAGSTHPPLSSGPIWLGVGRRGRAWDGVGGPVHKLCAASGGVERPAPSYDVRRGFVTRAMQREELAMRRYYGRHARGVCGGGLKSRDGGKKRRNETRLPHAFAACARVDVAAPAASLSLQPRLALAVVLGHRSPAANHLH